MVCNCQNFSFLQLPGQVVWGALVAPLYTHTLDVCVATCSQNFIWLSTCEQKVPAIIFFLTCALRIGLQAKKGGVAAAARTSVVEVSASGAPLGRKLKVAVVGGGPAGSCAAETLAKSGIETYLIERKLDNCKPCGGAIPLCMVDEFDLPNEIIDRKVRKKLTQLLSRNMKPRNVHYEGSIPQRFSQKTRKDGRLCNDATELLWSVRGVRTASLIYPPLPSHV